MNVYNLYHIISYHIILFQYVNCKWYYMKLWKIFIYLEGLSILESHLLTRVFKKMLIRQPIRMKKEKLNSWTVNLLPWLENCQQHFASLTSVTNNNVYNQCWWQRLFLRPFNITVGNQYIPNVTKIRMSPRAEFSSLKH